MHANIKGSISSFCGKMVQLVRIEGNIGVGKSSLLSHLEDNEPPVCTVPEPVSSWTHHLEGLYSSPHSDAWSLPMQSLAMCTRAESLLQALARCKDASDPAIVVIERSQDSARIFADNTLSGQDMDAFDTLVARYDAALGARLEQVCTSDTITVYLRAHPEVCAQRMAKRSRRSERGISLEYLQAIHTAHETRFLHGADLVVECCDKTRIQVASEVKKFLSGLGSASLNGG